MAKTVLDCVIYYQKKLNKYPDDDDVILNAIHKLSKIPITIEILKATGIGKCIRKLSKRNDAVGDKAKAVLHKWRDVFAKSESAQDSKLSAKSNKIENLKKEKSSIKHGPTKKESLEDRSHSVSNTSFKQSHLKSVNNSLLNGSNSSSFSDFKEKKPHQIDVDYDPCTETNKTYDPECPELFPTDNKMVKTKKHYPVDAYKPSSLKNRSKNEKPFESVDKLPSKKIKLENPITYSPDYVAHTKSSLEKKNKHSSLTDSPSVKDKSIKAENDSAPQNDPHLKMSKNKTTKNETKEKETKSHKLKPKVSIKSSEEFTSSNVTFEDCLGLNDIVAVKKKKSSKVQSPAKKSSLDETLSDKKKVVDKTNSLSVQKVPQIQILESSPVSKSKVFFNTSKESPVMNDPLASYDSKLLPNIRSFSPSHSSLNFKKKEAVSNEDVIKFTSSRKEKTAIYSGKKSYFAKVPTLLECCTAVLIEYIDYLGYMPEVPYCLLNPVLEKCSADQLFIIESYNPHLLDSTNELWKIHCKRDCRLLSPQEHETWRELYLRARDEREKKLKRITANISASALKSNPVRQVKLAYVDSVAKPPRDVARRQAKHGTGQPVNNQSKTVCPPVTKAEPSVVANSPVEAKKGDSHDLSQTVKSKKIVSEENAVVNSSPASPVANSKSTVVSTSIVPKKPKVAPLMAKTLKAMKQCYRRK